MNQFLDLNPFIIHIPVQQEAAAARIKYAYYITPGAQNAITLSH
jgi:hypothetical protein